MGDPFSTELRPTERQFERDGQTISSHLRALREVYWLLREGQVDNALHALDAYLIRQDVNPEDYAGLDVLSPVHYQDRERP